MLSRIAKRPGVWPAVAGLALASGCGNAKKSGSSHRYEVDAALAAISVDAALESDNGSFVQYLVQAANPNTQVIKASPKSPIAGASLVFPPGSIGIDSHVSFGGCASLATKDNLAKLIPATAVVNQSGAAAEVAFDYDINTVTPYTIVLPLPAGKGSLAVIAIENVPGSDTAALTLIPTAGLRSDDSFVSMDVQSYGLYQPVYLSEATQAATVSVAKPAVPAASGAAPGAFAISGPTDKTSPAHPKLSWSAASGATSYRVQLDAKDPSCSTPFKDYPSVTDTNLTIDAGDGVNYACVTASNASGTTQASNTGFKFVAATTLPSVPAKPTSDPITDGVSVTFHWTAVTATEQPIVNYLLQVGTTPGGTDIYNGLLPTLQKEVLGTPGKTFYARVAAVDAAGNQSDFSAVSDGATFN